MPGKLLFDELTTVRKEVNMLYGQKKIKVLKGPLSLEEAAQAEKDFSCVPLFVEKLKMRSETFSLACSFYSSRSLIAQLLGINAEIIRDFLLRSIEEPGEVVLVNKSAAQEKVIYEPDLLRELPVIRHTKEEKSPYITSGVFFVNDPETGRLNLSIHRCMVLSENKLVFRAVEGRDLDLFIRKAEKSGRNIPVAVAIGVGLPVMLAASTSVWNLNEMKIASRLKKGRAELIECKSVDAVASADAEIILEGEILAGKKEHEGPFREIGGIDVVRKQPVMEVKALTRRRRAIYYDVIPGGNEHGLLIGLSKEPLIYRELRKYVDVKDVRMSPAGMYWFEVILKIHRNLDQDPLTAAFAALNIHPSAKRIIVVDEDVDVDNYIEVHKAVLRRSYPPIDYHIIQGVKGSSLDHTNIRKLPIYREDRKEILLVEFPKSKVIIDATKKNPYG